MGLGFALWCLLAVFQTPASQSVRGRSSQCRLSLRHRFAALLFKGARLARCEDDGKLLNEALPLANDRCPIRLFFRRLCRHFLALPSRDVALLTGSKDPVDEPGTRDLAYLARVQRSERPSSDQSGFRSKNSRGLPVCLRTRKCVFYLVQWQTFESQYRGAGRRNIIRVVADFHQLR